MIEGAKLATVMRGGLKHRYGSRAEKLTEFGLQPFRGRKAKPAETPDVPPPQSVASPQPAPDTDEQ